MPPCRRGATAGNGLPHERAGRLDAAHARSHELEKRITDLKTVQFWLEQNARMIAARPFQGLEVQRMTLSTLKGMNVSMDALRESFKARATATRISATA